jgi:hypothetical protein
MSPRPRPDPHEPPVRAPRRVPPGPTRDGARPAAGRPPTRAPGRSTEAPRSRRTAARTTCRADRDPGAAGAPMAVSRYGPRHVTVAIRPGKTADEFRARVIATAPPPDQALLDLIARLYGKRLLLRTARPNRGVTGRVV